MALEKITQVSGRAVYVAGDDIDTDRIIPARYLKCVTFDDLAGKHFYDVRFDTDGNPTGHPLDDPGDLVLVEGATVVDDLGVGRISQISFYGFITFL